MVFFAKCAHNVLARRCVLVRGKASESRDATRQLNKHLAALIDGVYAPHVKLCQGPAGRGLVATAPVRAKDPVLIIPERNALTVPEGSSVYAWECNWLEPFEAQHGELPPTLAYFIADHGVPALARISTLILYMRKHKGKLWQSWMALLPPLESATSPAGPWTQEELLQLQLEPLKMLMADNHAEYAASAAELFQLLTEDPDNIGLKALQLADSVSDCMWAQFIASTRGSDAGTDDTSVHPLHDMMNHSDSYNCQAGVSTQQDGFIVQAAVDISPGTELTISYAKPERLSSVEMLLSWGFHPPTRPTDWAFSQHIHALPLLPWEAVVAAAVNLVTAGSSRGQLLSAGSQGLLLAAVGSLPLQLPTGPPGSLLQLQQLQLQPGSAAVSYSHGAAVLAKYGVREGPELLLPGQQQQQQQQVSPVAAERFKAPNPQQRAALQDVFMEDVLEKLMAGSGSSSSSSSDDALEQQQQQQQRDQPLLPTSSSQDVQLQVQLSCARALQHCCQLQLLQCSTTIEQDVLLLQLLQQQQSGAGGKAGTKGFSKASSRGFAAAAGAGAASGATAMQQKKRGSAAVASKQEAATAQLSSDDDLRSAVVPEQQLTEGAEQQQQQQKKKKRHFALQEAQQLQQQVLGALLLLRASQTLDARSSSSSGGSSSSDKQAAQVVIAAVDAQVLCDRPVHQLLQLPEQQQLLLLVKQQAQLAALLDALQQQQQNLEGSAAALLAELLPHPSSISRARLAAAIGARLERKRMLQLCAHLCEKACCVMVAASK